MRSTMLHWLTQWTTAERLQELIPVTAGMMMLCASVSPWLNDPLGKPFSAWDVPIDIGWQFRAPILNYGILCLFCALYTFAVAFAQWISFRGSRYFLQRFRMAGLLCLVPCTLFFFQFLCSDIVTMNLLAQHKIQMLLIQRHIGYSLAEQLIPLSPFTIDISTLQGRMAFLVDQMTFGPLLPLISAAMSINPKRLRYVQSVNADGRQSTATIRSWRSRILLAVLAFILLVVFGRAPASMISENQARTLLASGNYEDALAWMDRALIFSPELNGVSFYHIERGEALYFLHPLQQSAETQAYLAYSYRQQGSKLVAYQELLSASQSHYMPRWILDEMSITLENLSEPTTSRATLLWIKLLVQRDPNNVFGHYIIGRFQYDLHNYEQCAEQMNMVLKLSTNDDVQSTAYTYIALSDAGQRDFVDERLLLLKAIALDPAYRNNTARGELSGLR